MIEHWVSNLNLLVMILTTAISLEGFINEIDDPVGFLVVLVIYWIQTIFWIDLMLHESVESIKYVDRDWDKVESGKLLCPSLFYLIDWCTYDNVTDSLKIETEEALIADEAGDNLTNYEESRR